MDPQATLRRIIEAARDRDSRRLAAAVRDLHAWLARGGFAPIAHVPRGWILPDGARVLGEPRAAVVETVIYGRGKDRVCRSRILIQDAATPCNGRGGWIDTDRLVLEAR